MKEMRIMRSIGDIDDKYIDEAAPVQKKSNAQLYSWVKYAGIAACAALVLGIGVFVVKQNVNLVDSPSQTGTETTQPASSDLTQIVNPCIEYAAIEEAEKAVGFDIEIPDSYGFFSERSYAVLFGEMIEVRYLDADGNTGLCIRKASGTEDISGDYSAYENVSEIEVGGCSVTLKGNEDKYSLAVWSFGDYSYAVSADFGASEDELTEIIKEIE